ncbi:MAG: SGNH/GDSL hydrolase family protein [Patescibacteria group bacterium]
MTNRKSKSLLVNFSLSLLALVFFSCTTEVVLRIYTSATSTDICNFNKFRKEYLGASTSGFYKLSDNPDLVVELRPLAEKKADGEDVNDFGYSAAKINADGIRADREYAVPKPPNTYRIAAVGDSTTFGWGVGNNGTYPKILEDILKDQWRGKNVDVINFGVPGYNGKQKLVVLKEKIMKYDPDLVVMGWLIDDDNPPTYVLPPSKVVGFLLSNSNLFMCFKKKFMPINYPDAPPKERYQENASGWKASDEFFGEIADFSRKKNIPVVMVILPVWQPWEKNVAKGIIDVNQLLQTMAEKKGLRAIDMFPFLKDFAIDGTSATTFAHDSDIWHPNPMGNALIAYKIYNYLLQNHLIPLSKNISGIKFVPPRRSSNGTKLFGWGFEYSQIKEK